MRMKMMVERKAQRYPTKLVVTNINGQPVTDALLLDISPLGAKLESSTPLAPSYSVNVVVLLPGAQNETNLTGVVTWMRPLLTSSGRFLMGLEFYVPLWQIDLLGRSGKI
jgi:hypothetical protein